ncbi:MAG: VacB/RNase II family 3'-5' exoribonuclease [Campylobacterales bacterium]|nr:VacB/RNase II family 3'-5' exoribonuclease [Campylobacterales bacterium]
MDELFLNLLKGVREKDIPRKDVSVISELKKNNIIKIKNKDIYVIDSAKYKIGTLDVSRNGIGFLSVIGEKSKDLLIESYDLNGASRGDMVIAKRVYNKKSSRPAAKVVFIVKRAYEYSVCLVQKDEKHRVSVINMKTGVPVEVTATTKSLKQLPNNTVLKVKNDAFIIEEVLGVLDDPMVDEKISLALFNKNDTFSTECETQALSYGKSIDKSMYPNRVDLTNLDFCTIDPVDAKDFDDAIYLDTTSNTLYVAIADVSEYVTPYSPIDKEAKNRGFSIYFPHRAIPMLPRNLSENICSLKPNEDRLSFVFKMELDLNSLEVKRYELLNCVINSKKRYNYDQVDRFLENDFSSCDEVDKKILLWMLPLFELTKKIKAKRLENGFDFHSDEIRMILDENNNLVATKAEIQTNSHALIEDCMLLANKCSANMVGSNGIFRVHEAPDSEDIDELLDNLASIGITPNGYHHDVKSMIKAIQQSVTQEELKVHVDKLIIRAQQQARYSNKNVGHFGLGFEEYSHFTSPIRRYSDLTLHRLLKAKIAHDEKLKRYLLENIESLCMKISTLEREAQKVEWDFQDRKLARWAMQNIGNRFNAIITDTEKNPIAIINDTIIGARVFLRPQILNMFTSVVVEIIDVNLANAKIFGEIVPQINENSV